MKCCCFQELRNGVLEYWSNGVMEKASTSGVHHSVRLNPRWHGQTFIRLADVCPCHPHLSTHYSSLFLCPSSPVPRTNLFVRASASYSLSLVTRHLSLLLLHLQKFPDVLMNLRLVMLIGDRVGHDHVQLPGVDGDEAEDPEAALHELLVPVLNA